MALGRWAARAGMGLLLGASARAQIAGGPGSILDPKTHASPSGEVTLFVDPSERTGAGAASYRCLREGVELWSGTRPYTLREAVVSDDGQVAGYAYAAGYLGGPDDALTILLLDADGRACIEEHRERSGTWGCLGGPDPMLAGLFLDPENDRLVVRARTHAFGNVERWWTWSLSSGATGPELEPEPRDDKDWRLGWIVQTHPIPGTGLVLVYRDWWSFDDNQFGSMFSLLDAEGEEVWHLAWPEDCTVRGNREASVRRRDEVRASGPILDVGPGSFTLRRAATDERLTFDVRRIDDEHAGFAVREVLSVPFDPVATTAREPVASRIPTLAPQKLGTIHLDAADSLETIGVLVPGPEERLYAADLHTGTVAVFDRVGAPLHVWPADPGDLPRGSALTPISVTDAGDLYLGSVPFAADGTRRGPIGWDAEPTPPRLWARPDGASLWAVGSHVLCRLDATGAVLRRIERTAANHWLRTLHQAAVAPDGSLALTESEDANGPVTIHLFTAEGDPLRSFEVPEGMGRWAPFAYDGARLAVVVSVRNGPATVLLLDEQGAPVGRFRPEEKSPSWQPFFAAEGRELWLFDGGRRVERYAL